MVTPPNDGRGGVTIEGTADGGIAACGQVKVIRLHRELGSG